MVNTASALPASVETGDVILYLSMIVLGLIFSAFFSSSEVAYFSQSNRIYSEESEKLLDPAEIRVRKMIDHPRRLLATILIGNTFANIIAAVFAAVLTGMFASYIGIPEWIVYAIEVVILTFIIVVLTEITPKVLAFNDSTSISVKLSGLLYLFFVLFGPVAKIISRSSVKLESRIPKSSEAISSEDIRTIAEVGELHGTLRGDEREIIENVIEFGNTTVKEVMTSRVNMIAINLEMTLNDVIDLIESTSISRFPLFENDMDNIVGIIHSKDLLPFLNQKNGMNKINWKLHARKAFFIPASKKIDDLLKDFQREKTHVAIVVDEYGGTEGLVTLDDVLEEIIGEFKDEYSGQERLYTRRKNGDYVFDSKIDLDEVGEILSLELTTSEDEYETIGGLVYHLLERIPETNETVNFKNLELTVHKVENNRIQKVRVKVLDPENEEKDETRDADTDSDT